MINKNFNLKIYLQICFWGVSNAVHCEYEDRIVSFQKFKITDTIRLIEGVKIEPIYIELCITGFLGSRIMNKNSNMKIEKWRSQYSG